MDGCAIGCLSLVHYSEFYDTLIHFQKLVILPGSFFEFAYKN
jgi:hypothetical protein